VHAVRVGSMGRMNGGIFFLRRVWVDVEEKFFVLPRRVCVMTGRKRERERESESERASERERERAMEEPDYAPRSDVCWGEE
jgi:hypothetical protein